MRGSGSVRADSRADNLFSLDSFRLYSLEHDRIKSWHSA